MKDLGKEIDKLMNKRGPDAKDKEKMNDFLNLARKHYLAARAGKDIGLMQTIGNKIAKIHDWQHKHGF